MTAGSGDWPAGGTDNVSAGGNSELRRHATDAAGRGVNDDDVGCTHMQCIDRG
jgi:hypothetical protein